MTCRRPSQYYVVYAVLLAALAVAGHARAEPVGSACLADPGIGGQVLATRPAAQVQYEPTLDLTFNTRTTADGGIRVEGRTNDFVLRKTVYEDGRSSLQLESRNDRVRILVDGESVQVTRGRHSVSLHAASTSEDEQDRVRTVLAGSRAVRMFRALAASIEASGAESAPAIATLMSDAVVGMLDGDPGAPGRVARHLARHAKARIRTVAMQGDCYGTWEGSVYRASYELEDCLRAFSVWNPVRNVCGFRWTMQVESYWFRFLTCSGFPAV